MSLLNDLVNMFVGGQAVKKGATAAQAIPSRLPRMEKRPMQPMAVKNQGQINSAPFKMYEDNSFQGDPRQFIGENPGYRFFEDNTFSAPSLRIAPPAAPRSGAAYSGVQMARGLHGDSVGTFQPQGVDNPGFIPFQNSGFGVGGAVNLQPTFDPQARKRLY